MVIPSVAGLILAGGRSSRFGADKATALLGGRPLLAWAIAALDRVCESVAVSAAAGAEAEALARDLGHVVLTDDPGHAPGPLAGVAAGLAWAGANGVTMLVSLPCDTPLVSGGQIRTLIGAIADAPAAFAVTAAGPQPLCCVWRVAAAGSLAGSLAGGEHPAAHGLLTRIGARAVAFADASAFANVNTRGDLALLEAAFQ